MSLVVEGASAADVDASFDDYTPISVAAGNIDDHGQNNDDGYYIAGHPDTPSINAVFTDVVVGDTTYTYFVSLEDNIDFSEIYEIGNFAHTILRDIVDDVAEISYKDGYDDCLLYTSPSPRDRTRSRMPSSA